jgi:tetratricopeptide (TPR) repeat protein
MNGKKMLDTDPLLSLTLFEAFLRDYNVGYIVALVTDPGIREFEFQMLQSKRFAFTSEYRAGSLEVIKVHHLYREETADAKMKPGTIQPLPGATAVEEGARALFRQGIVLMETGRYDEAINVFNILVEITRGSGNLALFKGIALEFGGRFNEALWLFDRFRYQPQAGPFIKHAWYHQMLIRDFQAASRDSLTKYARAMIFHKISANYWDLGFRRRAFEVLRLALQVDSAFTPGMVFGMYYSLQLGDTVGAKRFLSRLQKADSSHIIIKPMRRLFSLMDSVQLAKGVPERIGYQLGLARGYGNIGVRELTIDQTLAILKEDPKNLAALELLATAYDVKDRRWPMIQVLQRILEIKPNHDRARRRLEELQSHL